MMGKTEQRLRDATAALGQTIQQADIPRLQLRERAVRRARRPQLGQRQRGPRSWLIPLAAATSVLAVTGLVILAGLVNSAGQARHHGGRAQPSATAAGMPRYIVTYGGGRGFGLARQGYVRATATGRVVARIRPAARDFVVEGLAAAPGDRTFYLIGEAPFSATEVQIECFRLVIGPDGRPGVPQRLPGPPLPTPVPPTSDATTSIPLAVSPDGKELAYPAPGLPVAPGLPNPYASQSVIVQNVATGARRSWSAWPAAHTQVSQVSWADGGSLGIVAALGDAGVSHGAVVPDSRTDLNVFMILNTKAAGSQLITDSRLVTYAAATVSSAGVPRPYPPPGPYQGLLSQDGRNAYLRVHPQDGPDQLVELSTASGTVTRVLLSGPQATNSEPISIDGDDLLFGLPLRQLPTRSAPGIWVSGHLAGIKLPAGQITPLPFPIYDSWIVPPQPLQAAW
jgi:hypothetical protein